MKEAVLQRFFVGRAGADEVAADLQGSIVVEGVVRRHLIEDAQGDFPIEPSHLIRVCDAVISGQLQPGALQSIGFCMVASDSFSWDSDTPEGERVAEVVYDWSAPEINLPLTVANVERWRAFLLGDGSRP